MPRAQFQVVVIPFRRDEDQPRFAVFLRSDAGYWQAIAGGGEGNEPPIDAARREALEEAGISAGEFIQLKSMDTVPVVNFKAHTEWPSDLYVIPQYTFAVEVTEFHLALSDEHTDYRWVVYEEAEQMLRWQSNKNALWELNERLKRNDLGTTR